jgi:hypothetical protein
MAKWDFSSFVNEWIERGNIIIINFISVGFFEGSKCFCFPPSKAFIGSNGENMQRW